MADGGSWRDTLTALREGIRWVHLRVCHPWHPDFGAFRFLPFAEHVWRWGHDDQRGSWLAHIGVSAAISTFAGVVGAWGPAGWEAGYWRGAFAAFVFYGLRELGDMVFHREKAKDAKRIDADTDWQGRAKRGVTPEYDGWADFDGPLAHFIGASLLFLGSMI